MNKFFSKPFSHCRTYSVTGAKPRWECKIRASRGQNRVGNAKFVRHGAKTALGTQNSCVTGAKPRWEHKIRASRGQNRAGNTKFVRHGGKTALGMQKSCVTRQNQNEIGFVTHKICVLLCRFACSNGLKPIVKSRLSNKSNQFYAYLLSIAFTPFLFAKK